MGSSNASPPAILIGRLDPESEVNNHSQRIHLDHCTLNGGTYSSTALQLVSCDSSSIIASKFYGITTVTNPVTLGAYCNGISFAANSFYKCTSSLLIQQASNIVVIGNAFRSASDIQEIILVNCQNVQRVANSFSGQLDSNAIQMYDISGTSFGSSANILIQSNNVSNYANGVYIEPAGGSVSASQVNVVISNNLFGDVTTPWSVPSSVESTIHNNPQGNSGASGKFLPKDWAPTIGHAAQDGTVETL
jgi:hypothetical protein